MTVKRFTHLALIFATLAGLVFAISAQDDDSKTRGSRFGIGSSAILEATGLDEAGLKEALQAGSTIAELVEANGGVVDSVIAELVAAASAAINTRMEAGQLTQERADSILEMLEARISARLNGSFEGLSGKGRFGFAGRGRFGFPGHLGAQGMLGMEHVSNAILEATGLDEAGLKEALQAGSTIAELVEANGGVVDSVIAELVAAATDMINEGVAARLETLEENISERVHSSFDMAGKGRRGRRGMHGMNDMDDTDDEG